MTPVSFPPLSPVNPSHRQTPAVSGVCQPMIATSVDRIGGVAFGVLDCPPIRRRGRRGGVGQPAPPFLHPEWTPYQIRLGASLLQRLPDRRPRLSPQPETRAPGGVGKPTPPSSCHPVAMGAAAVADVGTHATSATRGRRCAVIVSLTVSSSTIAQRFRT